MRRLVLSIAIAGLVAGGLAAPVSAAGVTRMVDKDGKASPGNCAGNATAFKRIQNAVNASGRDDRVLVCPGTYREQVIIGPNKDGLTLRSVGHLGATIRSPADLDEEFPVIVVIEPGANRVRVEHFRILHTAAVSPVAGFNECGAVGVLVAGRDAEIRSNTVIATGPGTLSDCGMALGIIVGTGDGSSAEVEFNVLRDFVIAGIVAGGSDAEMLARRNIVRFYHRDALGSLNAAAARRLARSALSGVGPAGDEEIDILAFSGIGLFDGATGRILENTVASHPAAGPLADPNGPNVYLEAGIVVEGGPVDSQVARNRVYRAYYGILTGAEVGPAGGSGGVAVSDNLVIANQYGIGAFGSGALIETNAAYANVVGLNAAPGSSGNTFSGNDATSNLGLDCYDQTGADLGSIDNSWSDNELGSDLPDGICSPIAP